MNDNGVRDGQNGARQPLAAPATGDQPDEYSAARRMACRRASRAWQARHSAKLVIKRETLARRGQA